MESVIDEKVTKKNYKNYLSQSFLAALSLFVALNLPLIVAKPLLIAAVGSTAFIVFAMPFNKTARPKRVIGGHLVSGLIGFGIYFLNQAYLPSIMSISVGVGLAILVMTSFDLEHPPAGGTVIFMIQTPPNSSLRALLLLILLASILTLISLLLKPYMKNLL